jgi:hypothetical protein
LPNLATVFHFSPLLHPSPLEWRELSVAVFNYFFGSNQYDTGQLANVATDLSGYYEGWKEDTCRSLF